MSRVSLTSGAVLLFAVIGCSAHVSSDPSPRDATDAQAGAAPSANSYALVTAAGPSIVDVARNQWSLTAKGQIAVNGVVDPITARVTELASVAGVVWQENADDLWWAKNSPSDTWNPTSGTPTSPLSGSADGIVTADGAIIDAAGNAWTLTANAQIAVNGSVDPITARVTTLIYLDGVIWQENADQRWWSMSNGTWTPQDGTSVSPIADIASGTGGSPFGGTPWPVPGTIQAEDFDDGGEGVAYHDNEPANLGPSNYRPGEGVDIKPSSDDGGGYAVGWTNPGEWLDYTINAAIADQYTMALRVATAVSGARMHVELDGADVSGQLAVPVTGAWDTSWETVSASNITISAGLHVVRLVIDAGPLDLNAMTITRGGGGGGGGGSATALYTRGAAIVDAQGNPVRITSTDMAVMVDVDDYGVMASLRWEDVVSILLANGINTVRVSTSDNCILNDPPVSSIDTNLNPTFAGLHYNEALVELMRIGSGMGLHFIVVSHLNEPNTGTGGQQPNGIWYDVGGASNGTDNAYDAPVDYVTTWPGTISDATWISVWQQRAQMFKGLGVIGYDLHNEPLMASSIGGSNPIGSTWGGYNGGQVGGDQDLRDAYMRAGNAIHAIDPDPLIICMFPNDSNGYDGRVLGWDGASLAWPVTLNQPNKVVYSTHEYPYWGPGATSGPDYVASMRGNWGFLYENDIAPVYIGEMGMGMRTQGAQDWANTIVPYLNGAPGSGMTLPASCGGQGVHWEWFPLMQLQFYWQDDGAGILTSDGTGVDPLQQSFWGQMLQR